MNWPWQVWCSVERQLSINTWPAAPGPVPGWKNERISSACGTQISSEAIYAPGVRQQAAETSADLSSIGLADDRLNRIVQIYGLTPLISDAIALDASVSATLNNRRVFIFIKLSQCPER